MRSLLKLFIMLFFVSATATALADNEGPKERVEAVANTLFAMLKAGPDNYVKSDVAASNITGNDFDTHVLAILASLVDFKSITKGVIGTHNAQLSAAQIEAFQRKFEQSIVKIITGVFDQLDSYELVVKEAKIKGTTYAQVPVEITLSSSEKYEILFSLSFKNSDWQVRNIIVNGVNLGITYRNQFNESMKSNKQNIDAVINAWSEPRPATES